MRVSNPTKSTPLNRLPRPLTRPLSGLVLTGALFVCLNGVAQKAQPPRVDYHRAEAAYRALSLRDEHGNIPDNAQITALVQKQKMTFDPAAWPGAGVSGTIGKYTAGIDTNSWVWVGPGNIGGRVRSILVNPTNSAIMWAGSVCGGVWKTTNSAASWFPMNDFMGNLAIGSMVMDPTDPNTIYAGTGEGFSSADALRGAGIFKTTNGEGTWTQLPSTANSTFYYVNRLSICPTNHLVLLAATGTGISRSTDGGTTWTTRYSAFPILDIAYHPTDGSKAVASGSTYGLTGLVLYTTDSGLTWNNATGLPAAGGRVEVAYAPTSPNVVYASCNNNQGEVYASTDGGMTFGLKNTGNSYLSGQGWYDNAIWVDPTNPNILIVGGTDLWRSTDGGVNFTDIGGYSGGIHPDQHCVIQTPAYNGTSIRTLFIGNDGGVFTCPDAYNVSPSRGWSELNNNLGITEFYGGAGNAASGTIVCGAQDNGTLTYTTGGGPQGWTAMFGGDGGRCAADATDPNYFYGEYVYLQIHRSVNGGATSSYIITGLGDAGVPGGGGDPDGEGPDGDPDAQANFIAPFVLDPNNPNIMLAGGSNLWRSVNVKATTPSWTPIKPNPANSFISAIAVAPGNSDNVWVGHNNGDVYSTANGTAANPTWTRRDLGSPNLPNRTCTRLTIDGANPNRVFATFGGFSADNVYVTSDGGGTWTNLAAGLPAVPVRSLVIAPFNTNYLYIGTEIGVFASTNGGIAWSPANDGPASVSVEELFWMNQTLVAVSHGRGVFKIGIATAPAIALAGASLSAESCPNGVIDPNELVTVNFTLTNRVAIPTTNLTATLLATNGVVSPGGPQNFGALVAGGAAAIRAYTFMATGQCGGTITASLQLHDGTNLLGTVSAAFALGVPIQILAQNFDGVAAPNLPAGWTAASAGALWYTTNGVNDTSPNSAFAPEPSIPSDDSLVSPTFHVSSSAAKVSFRHRYQTEFPYDGGVLEIAIGGGGFNDIITAGGSFVSNGYNQAIGPTDSVLNGRSSWTGASGGFITSTVNLPSFVAGQPVQLRWRFATDTGNSTSVTGWFVDTISVSDGSTCCVPRPQIQSITRTNSNVTVTWTAISGQGYRLQSSTNLLSTNWLDVAGDVLASGPSASKSDPGATDALRFYRVRVLP